MSNSFDTSSPAIKYAENYQKNYYKLTNLIEEKLSLTSEEKKELIKEFKIIEVSIKLNN